MHTREREGEKGAEELEQEEWMKSLWNGWNRSKNHTYTYVIVCIGTRIIYKFYIYAIHALGIRISNRDRDDCSRNMTTTTTPMKQTFIPACKWIFNKFIKIVKEFTHKQNIITYKWNMRTKNELHLSGLKSDPQRFE